MVHIDVRKRGRFVQGVTEAGGDVAVEMVELRPVCPSELAPASKQCIFRR